MLSKSYLLNRSTIPSPICVRTYASRAALRTYRCHIDAEPLHRYRAGGYHPIELGHVLKNGRYRIIHKLGWGGYATTWAAIDRPNGCHVAVKVITSDARHTRELEVLQIMSNFAKEDHHVGSSRINQTLDHFTLTGPNGTHACLVLELLGPSIADVVESYCIDDRLPARLARQFARQAFQGLDFLAKHGIGHGDLHTRNLAIEVPGLDSLDENSLLSRLGEPEMGEVSREDGGALESNVPSHMIRPVRFRPRDILSSSSSVRLIDFGEAFLSDDDVPGTLNTPLPVRAPEVIFGDVLDYRVDLWSAGCLLFELVTGQPPFDTFMLTPPLLVQQMLAFDTGGLPPRWQAQWKMMKQSIVPEEQSYTLQEWLEEVYFDGDRPPEFTREEIKEVGCLITGLLKLEPSRRATAGDVLDSTWFTKRETLQT